MIDRLVTWTRGHRGLLLILVLGSLLKIGLYGFLAVSHPGLGMTHDTPSYIAPVTALLHYASFSVNGVPEVQRTPGYPLMLGIVVAVFGDVRWAIPLQALLGSLTALLVWSLIERTYDGPGRSLAGVVAVVVVLLDPALSIVQLWLVTEPLFTLVLFGGLWCTCVFTEDGKSWRLLAGTILLAAAAYVRPVSILLGIPVVLVAALSRVRRGAVRAATAAVAATVLYAGAIGVWVVRNYVEVGVPTFSTIASKNLYEYIGAAALARSEHRDWGRTRTALQDTLRERHLPLAEEVRVQREEGLAMIRAHPTAVAAVTVRGILTNALDPGTGSLASMLGFRKGGTGLLSMFVSMTPVRFAIYLWHHERAFLVFAGLGGVWVLLLWGFALKGAWDLRTDWRPTHWILALSTLYLLVVAAGPNAMARFRVPAVPMLAYFAGIGFAGLVAHRRERSMKQAGASG